MNLFDTHCHIQSLGSKTGETNTRALWSKVNFTAEEAVERAAAVNVSRLICVGCDPADSRLATDFALRFKGAYASIGIHPHEARHYAAKDEVLSSFAALKNKKKVVAIGECGLDYFYRHSEPKEQAELLRFQLELALEADLPVIFHVRQAFSDFWPVFDSYPKLRGVLHSYTDTRETLDKAIERGLYIGVNGIATFARQPGLQQMFKSIPLSRLLLETDAPFLTPTPYRGTINEPKHIATIASYLADARGENLEDLAAATTANANLLFRL